MLHGQLDQEHLVHLSTVLCENWHLPVLHVLFWLQVSFDRRFLKYFQDNCTFHSFHIILIRTNYRQLEL